MTLLSFLKAVPMCLRPYCKRYRKKEIRLERICKRDNIDISRAELRMSAQLDEGFFRSHSDIVIENNFSIEQVELAAQKAAEAINNLMR